MAYDKQKLEFFDLSGGVNQKVSPYKMSPTELSDILNLDFRFPGSLHTRPGTTTMCSAIEGITGVFGFRSGVEWSRDVAGADPDVALVFSAGSSAMCFYQTGATGNAIRTGITGAGDVYSFESMNNALFCASGEDFFKVTGQSTWSLYGLPAPPSFGVTATTGGSLSPGTYLVGISWVNDLGFIGPHANTATLIISAPGGAALFYGLTSPPANYGISGIAFFRNLGSGTDLFGTTISPAFGGTFADKSPVGVTLYPTWPELGATFTPQFISEYNSMLFMGGFPENESLLAWSDVGIPELVEASFNANIKQSDGVRLSGSKRYAGALIVAKETSLHRVIGTNPEQLDIQEITDQYGCLNGNTMVVYENRLWFLDKNGIIEYDGANLKLVSQRKEPTFRKMNITAARKTASAVHCKHLNQVWFAIPTNDVTQSFGSYYNNVLVIYDYILNIWTEYKIPHPVGALAVSSVGGQYSTPIAFGLSGAVMRFDEALYSDLSAANGITSMITTRWANAGVETGEQMWRRFWVNYNADGPTLSATVSFKRNYGSTQIAPGGSQIIELDLFQSRVETEISARSIQATVTWNGLTSPVTFFGYGFDYRFQRSV